MLLQNHDFEKNEIFQNFRRPALRKLQTESFYNARRSQGPTALRKLQTMIC